MRHVYTFTNLLNIWVSYSVKQKTDYQIKWTYNDCQANLPGELYIFFYFKRIGEVLIMCLIKFVLFLLLNTCY